MFDDTKLKKMTLKHSEQKTELDHSHVSDDPPPLGWFVPVVINPVC